MNRLWHSAEITCRRVVLACAVLCLSFTVAPVQAQDTTSNLVGHWMFDETSGGTVNDSSGNNYHGSLSSFADSDAENAAWRPDSGAIDGALWLSHAEDEYVRLRDWEEYFDFDTNYTISLWVYLVPHGSTHYIFKRGLGSTASENHQYMISVTSSGTLRFTTGDKTIGDTDYFGRVAFNQWQHIVCAEDAGTKRCYVNGEQSGTPQTNDTVDPFGAGTRLDIGRRKNSGEGAMNGLVDDVRFYSRPLSELDIRALYARSDKACTAPVAGPGEFYYNLERRALQYCDGDNWVKAGLGSYRPVAVNFDGTSDYLTKTGSIGANDGNKFTFSFWINPEVQGTETWQAIMVLGAGTQSFLISSGPGDSTSDNMRAVYFYGRNSADENVFQAQTADIVPAGQWSHVLVSGDIGENILRIYVNGVQDTNYISLTPANAPIEFSRDDMAVGAFYLGSDKLRAGLADFWFAPGVYVDLSDASNRARFRSASGMPMYPGDDGSLFTGAPPSIFLSGDVDGWHTNRGTGGGFTKNGTLDEVISVPATAAPDLTDGLIAYWKMDETSGTAVTDSAGTSNGTFSGEPAVVPAPGQVDGALTFDGSDDRVNISAFDIVGTGMTIAGWVYLESLMGQDSRFISKTDDSSTDDHDWALYFADSDGEVRLRLKTTGSSPSTEDSGLKYIPPLQRWFHIALTYDEDSAALNLYADGSLVHTDTQPGGGAVVSGSGKAVALGNNPSGVSGRPLHGHMDEVRVYDRALSPDEIAALVSGTCTGPAGAGGAVIYNNDHKVMQYCNGVEWVAMSKIGGTGGGGCSSPAGTAGEVLFDSTNKAMQYCNSEDWVSIGKVLPPTDGLVAHWRLDEDSGTAVADSAGSNGGTFSGEASVVSTAGKMGGAFVFDGVDDRVSVPAFDVEGTGITLAAWIYYYSATASDQRIISKASGEPTDDHDWVLFLRRPDPVLSLRLTTENASGDAQNTYSTYTPPTDEWVHVVATYNADDAKIFLYANGEQVYSDTNSYGGNVITGNTTRNVGIGNQASGAGDRPFDGMIDDARVYERPLSPAEVKQLYNATR